MLQISAWCTNYYDHEKYLLEFRHPHAHHEDPVSTLGENGSVRLGLRGEQPVKVSSRDGFHDRVCHLGTCDNNNSGSSKRVELDFNIAPSFV